MSRLFVAASALLLTASPALALNFAPSDEQQATSSNQSQQASSAKPAKDPNRIICRREKEIGSRLNTKKSCMSAQEWEQQRQTQAAEVDKIQKARPLRGE